MCLCLIAFQMHPEFPLVLAENRDEFRARKTAPLSFWADAPEVMAGRDLEAGGTWLGATREGRVAALTNYRDPSRNRSGARSRGGLVVEFLRGVGQGAREYLEAVAARAGEYNDFNLIVGGARELLYLSSVTGELRELGPGIYGLSNHLLDTAWPKLVRAKERFAAIVTGSGDPLEGPARAELFGLLADRALAPEDQLPTTGVPPEWERRLSAIFVEGEVYGTRTSTLLSIRRDGRLRMVERSYDGEGGDRELES